ncbi:MAG: 2TM domain-containing protein [Desulfobacteraceae bacterium]|nr:MAG: 2TM domain-containing protein [Desulfobacteraceae bacterium]
MGINAFLIVINLLTNPFKWWFLFPLVCWGFGLFMHWMKLTMRLPDKKQSR